MKRLAYSYIRFSTKAQIEGTSLNRQLKRAREYAAQHDLHLDESSYQDLGISAFKSKNVREGALGAFLKAIDEGLVPHDCLLLVESLDRLSRAKPTEALELFIGIINRGVTIVTLADSSPAVYTADKINTDGGMTLFGSIMVLVRAHEESATKSYRAKKAIREKVESGKKLGKCPAWLRATEDRLGFTIVEEQANIVREVFRMRRDSIGSLRIAKHLNSTYGWKYTTPQVARLLQNPAVIGTRISQAGYEPIPDWYPAIISKTEFYDVQRLMSGGVGTKRGRRAEDEPNLFSGLLFCGHCGARMRFFRASKTVSQRYVRCSAGLTQEPCQPDGLSAYVNYDALEKELIGWLLLDQDEDFISLLDKKPSRKMASSAELKALKEQHARLLELYMDGALMNPKVVIEKMNAVEMQIRFHEAQIIEPEADELMFVEKAWDLVERHDNALLAVADGEDPAELYAVRRELKAAFQRSLERINAYGEQRIGDTFHCKFSVQFRGYDGVPKREFTRPALNNVRGVFNGHTPSNKNAEKV